MKHCALCAVELTDNNRTDEHIIPNVIGGRMTVRDFICEPCNNSSGGEWDKALAEQFSDLSLLVGIKRQRGTVPPIRFETKLGKLVGLNIDGQMFSTGSATKTEDIGPQGGTINIQAATHEQADKIAEGLSRKYRKQGASDVRLTKYEETTPIFEEIEFNLSFGGSSSGKSYVKTAMAMAAKHGFSTGDCECAEEYLIYDGTPCFGYYYGDDVLAERPELLHIVAIEGCPSEKLLLAYIEYFSFFRIVVCLSRNYTGEAFKDSYALDPRVGGRMEIDFKLSFSVCDIEKLYNYDFYIEEELKSSLAKVLELIHIRFEELELNRSTEAAFEKAIKELGINEGDDLTDEQQMTLSSLIAHHLKPYFMQRLQRERQLSEQRHQ